MLNLFGFYKLSDNHLYYKYTPNTFIIVDKWCEYVMKSNKKDIIIYLTLTGKPHPCCLCYNNNRYFRSALGRSNVADLQLFQKQ
jgi:hypothetical protein